MYFLKDIQGKRVAYPTLKDIFVFLEKESLKSMRHYPRRSTTLHYFVMKMIDDGFESSIAKFGVGYEDTRNRGVHIEENPFEKQWLATKNKYIVLDSFGRVVSKKFIEQVYTQRFNDVHAYHSKRDSWKNNSIPGSKWIKSWSKRYKQRYKDLAVCKDELKAMTSMDEFDVEYPIRTKIKLNVKSRNVQYDANYRIDSRSWKVQGKKKYQWM